MTSPTSPKSAAKDTAARAGGDDLAEYIAFDEFRAGLPHGRFRVVVNPSLVGPFVAHRTHATALVLALIGPGVAAALLGHVWLGGGLVLAGIVLRRTVKSQAARILLHLASRVSGVYEHATQAGVMEVQRI